jgi:hypothetical protein
MLPDHAARKTADAAARGLGSDLILRDAYDTWETCSQPGAAPEESGTGAGIEGWSDTAETPESDRVRGPDSDWRAQRIPEAVAWGRESECERARERERRGLESLGRRG